MWGRTALNQWTLCQRVPPGPSGRRLLFTMSVNPVLKGTARPFRGTISLTFIQKKGAEGSPVCHIWHAKLCSAASISLCHPPSMECQMEVQTICNPVMYDTVILVMWCKSCILSCMEWEASEGLVVLVLHDYSNRVQYSFWHPYSEQVEVFLSICQADHTAAGSDCNFGQDLRLEKGLCSIFSQLSSCPTYVGKMVVAASVMVLQVHVAVKDGTQTIQQRVQTAILDRT